MKNVESGRPMYLIKTWIGLFLGCHLIAYSIFSLYRNTKTIHSIMMIWLDNFIESNYKLASGPPKDPGGEKNIFSKSKDIDS